MNKKMIGALAILCMLFCTLAFAPASVYADEYQYQVTVDGGLQGTVTGETKVEIANGGQWNPNDYMDKVTVKEKKYYLKGFQISGQEGLVGATKIDHDTDFVAVYGIKGDTVAYTVQYLDASGKELRESRTFYGNVGDKPVAAYQYIDGYQPQAYNITGTLQADASKNVFKFEYQPVAASSQPADSNGAANGTAGSGNGATGGAAVQGESGTAGNGAGNGAAVADADSQSQEPAEILDLDDEETPLADGEQPAAEEEEQGQKAGSHAIAYIVGGAAAVGILALILALLRRKTAEE